MPNESCIWALILPATQQHYSYDSWDQCALTQNELCLLQYLNQLLSYYNTVKITNLINISYVCNNCSFILLYDSIVTPGRIAAALLNLMWTLIS